MNIKKLCVQRSQGDNKEYGEVSKIDIMKSRTYSLDEKPKAYGVACYRLFPVEHEPNKYAASEEKPCLSVLY
jgi:hypothetical protein